MANTFIPIQTVTVGSGGTTTTISFTSIPSTYTDLVVKASLRDTRVSSGPGYIHLNFNGVSTNLSSRALRNVDGSVASTSRTDDYLAFSAAIDGQTANTFGNFELYVPNYTSTSTYKSFSIDSTNETNATTPIAQDLVAGLWSSTAAITSISLISEPTLFWKQYSTATLYGIKSS
jgi:hypothetical protein